MKLVSASQQLTLAKYHRHHHILHRNCKMSHVINETKTRRCQKFISIPAFTAIEPYIQPELSSIYINTKQSPVKKHQTSRTGKAPSTNCFPSLLTRTQFWVILSFLFSCRSRTFPTFARSSLLGFPSWRLLRIRTSCILQFQLYLDSWRVDGNHDNHFKSHNTTLCQFSTL